MTVMDVIWWWFEYVTVTYTVVWGIQSIWWWYVDKVLEGTEPECNGALQDHIMIDAKSGRDGTAEPSRVLMPGKRSDQLVPARSTWGHCRNAGSAH